MTRTKQIQTELLLATEEQGRGQEHRHMGTNRLMHKSHAFVGFWEENWGIWTLTACVWLSSWHSILLLWCSNVILGFPLLPSHVSHPCVHCVQRPHFMLSIGSISAVLWHQHRSSLWWHHPSLLCSLPNMHCLWPHSQLDLSPSQGLYKTKGACHRHGG